MGLVISEVAPLSQGARIGLLQGDVVEQINSWQAQKSCLAILTAQEIRQYKQAFVSKSHKDLRKERAAVFVSSEAPYFLKSPVPAWIDRYPFYARVWSAVLLGGIS